MWRMESENRLEGRRDPIARVFCCTRTQSSKMSSVFSVSEVRFICSSYQLNSATSKGASCAADRPRSSNALVGHCWVQAGCVIDEGKCVHWISLHRNPCSLGLWSISPPTTWPRKGTFPSLESSPPKFVTGHCGLRAKGECSEGSSDLSCMPALMQPYQFQLLLLLLIWALHLAPISSLQSVIKRW